MSQSVCKRWAYSLVFIVVFQSCLPAGELMRRVKRIAAIPIDKLHRKSPKAGMNPSIELLGKQIDWLEHWVETYGSVVSKQPDVWGEARMTKHRREVEDELGKFATSKDFTQSIQGKLSRSDQAYLALALSLGANLGGATAVPTPVQAPNAPPAPTRTPVATAVSLEPTVLADQFSRYLNHLNELRRINEGDDTADTPGYALNLVRLPVSLLPGHRTRTGYGAEVTFSVEPYMSEDLLSSTIRNLVINDVADQLALPIARHFNNDRQKAKAYLETTAKAEKDVDALLNVLLKYLADCPKGQTFHMNLDYLRQRLVELRVLARYVDKLPPDKRVFKIRLPNGPLDPKHACNCEQECECEVECEGYEIAVGVKEFSVFANEILTFGKANLIVSIGQHGCELQNEISIEVCLKLKSAKSIVTTLEEPTHANGFTIPIEIVGTPQIKLSSENSEEDASKSQRDNEHSFQAESRRSERANARDEVGPAFQNTDARSSLFRTSKLRYPPNPSTTTVSTRRFAINSSIATPTITQFRSAINRVFGNYRGTISRILVEARQSNIFGNVANSLNSLQGFSSPQRNRRSPNALPPSKMVGVYGYDNLVHISNRVFEILSQNPVAEKFIHLTDIHETLIAELKAAYAFLSREENQHYWQVYCTQELVKAISENDFGSRSTTIDRLRREFQLALPKGMQHTITGALCWTIIVESALLNEALQQDLIRASKQKGCACMAEGQYLSLTDPHPSPEANQAFFEYVNCRWPIHVFALDPVNQEQNISDQFSRRRELQLAAAVAVATGNMTANAAGRFVRRLETDIETIALNRTHYAFSHGNSTFGWRFTPRFQSPETGSTLSAFGETLFGISRDADIRDHRIEPGMRECVAVVIMPSFVPYVTINSRGNWYELTNPRKKQWTMHDTLHVSRNFSKIQSQLSCIRDANCYRPEDISGLGTTVQQLEKRLPQQTTKIQVPYENTRGGFELFNTGVTDLGPELLGWYGAPGIETGEGSKPTTLFLVGDGFSVHESRVIVGGRVIPQEDIMLLSRQIMEVKITPPGNIINYAAGNPTKQYFDIHVATPYGVTNHLTVPAVAAPKAAKADELSAKVKALEAHVATTIDLQLAVKDNAKLIFDVICEAPGDATKLGYKVREANKSIDIAYAIPTAIPSTTADIKMALQYKGKFLGTTIDVGLMNSPLSGNKGTLTLNRSRFVPVASAASGVSGPPPTPVPPTAADLVKGDLLKIDYADYAKTGKLELKGVFFLEIKGHLPKQLPGELDIEVVRPCDCCSPSCP